MIYDNKQSIFFLLIFVGSYLALNTVYGVFVKSFSTEPDPITVAVSKQVVWVLSIWDDSVIFEFKHGHSNVVIKNSWRSVIEVYEGCNGINVIIVFVSFLMAFRGKIKSTIVFALVGVVIIHIINLGRVAMLYIVEISFPRYLYFFHKYLFTGFIYTVVFGLWFLWIRKVKNDFAG